MNERNRNKPCTVCGKKLKNCGGHKPPREIWPWIAVILLVLTVGLIQSGDEPPTMPVPVEMNNFQRINKMLDVYTGNRSHAHWMIRGELHMDARVEMIKDWKPLVDDIITSHADVNELTRSVADLGDFTVAMMDPSGNFLSTSPDRVTTQVMLYPQELSRRMPALCWYNRRVGGIMLASLEWPRPILDGILYHEGHHRVCDKEGRPSATAPSNSDSYISEELDGHKIETAVFDAGSDGRYMTIVEDIISRKGTPENVQQLLGRLTAEDLYRLDDALSCPNCSREIAQVLAKHHVLTIGMEYLQRNNAPLAHEIELYRWLSQL